MTIEAALAGLGPAHEVTQVRRDRQSAPNGPVESEGIDRHNGLSVRQAHSSAELAVVNQLVQRMYATRSYQATPLSELDAVTTRSFLVLDGAAPIGTLSVRFDSSAGLLAEELFPAEVAQLRAKGREICEFTKLAMDRRARSPRFLAALFHVAYLLAHRVHGCGHLLIEVNPRHVRYYAAMLGFEAVGGPRHNARVDAPAILMALDLAHAQQQIQLLAGNPSPAINERSVYPYFFAAEVESMMLARLIDANPEIVDSERDGVRPASDSAAATCH